jgi:hypothetical protein
MTDMCVITVDTFTMAGTIADPLTRMVMRSDGVSEDELAALLFRIQGNLAARAMEAPVCYPARFARATTASNST